MLKIKELSKSFDVPYGKLEVLKEINVDVNDGDFVMIMGESGSGKTTFINCISTLLEPTSGSVYLNDQDISLLKPKEVEKIRLHDVAYVFQENYMIDGLTMIENIAISRLQYDENALEKAEKLMRKLNILDIKDKYPYQVSGGERQRAAICRALINEPKVLFADEPTASLNPKTAELLMVELKKLNEEGYTIIMVTHSVSMASYGTRLLVLSDGKFKIDTKLPKDDTHNYVLAQVSEYL